MEPEGCHTLHCNRTPMRKKKKPQQKPTRGRDSLPNRQKDILVTMETPTSSPDDITGVTSWTERRGREGVENQWWPVVKSVHRWVGLSGRQWWWLWRDGDGRADGGDAGTRNRSSSPREMRKEKERTLRSGGEQYESFRSNFSFHSSGRDTPTAFVCVMSRRTKG